MALKAQLKWAIAAVAAVTTVAASVSIANAYTINVDTNSGKEHQIIDSEDQADFKIENENEALKQAVRFELKLVSDSYNYTYYIAPKCTLQFGGYNDNNEKKTFGDIDLHQNNSGKFDGTFEGTLQPEYMKKGKFWLTLPRTSYTNVEFKSIAFYDSDDNCILYGSAGENLKYTNEFGPTIAVGPWTFYQLNTPEIDVDAIQNDDGTYALKADVSIDEPNEYMSIITSHDASEAACTFSEQNIVTEFTKDNVAINGTDVIKYNAGESTVNEYVYAVRSHVEITDTIHGGTVTLYSPAREKTVKLDKLKVNGGKPELADVPVIKAGKFKSSDELLNWLNNATIDNASSSSTDGALNADFVDSSVGTDLPEFRKASVPELDAAGVPTGKRVIGKAVFDSVSGFDPKNRKEHNITLTAHAVYNDVMFQNGFDNSFTVTVPYADYLDRILISSDTKSTYNYLEEFDITNGTLELTYSSDETETIKMTDPKVTVNGFYGDNGELPEANSQRTIIVTYTAANGEYSPLRSEGGIFTCTYVVTISDVNAPVITPGGGNFRTSKKVTITAETGADIYYTLDGSVPTTASTKYTGEFTIDSTCTVKAIAVKNNRVSSVASASFTKRSSGSISVRPSSPSVPTEEKVYVDGTLMTWDESIDYIKKIDNSAVSIDLNSLTTVPEKVVKAIAAKPVNVHFTNGNSICGWYVKGSEITTPTAADLTIIRTSNIRYDGLRGVEGTQFRANNTGIPASVEIAFDKKNAGEFANIYKFTDNKLVFITCTKTGADGKAVAGVNEQGDYVVMLYEFSDRLGDANNDGIINSIDASAILRNMAGLEKIANPAVADFNGDGVVDALDAAAILRNIAGLQ